jgi:hypothetical protein
VKRGAIAAALFVAVSAVGAHADSSDRGGFEPQWLAAVSAKDFWIGGNRTVLHTSDGGRHFDRLPAPPAAGTITFADSRDGFAFGWRTPLYATHDGGSAWHRLSLRSVLAFAAADGTAYAVTGRCARDGTCRDARLMVSPVSRDAWHSAHMPFSHAEPNFDLAARGSDVWLFGGSSSGRYRLRNVLARSTNGGRTFVTGPAPCYADLGAELDPVSSGVVWAFCPTGMMGIAWRSSDGGARFNALSIPRCCVNSSLIAAASADVAVLASVSGLLRTTDGGATWRFANAPRNRTYASIEFIDDRNGFALGSVGSDPPELWRTTDAGARWHAVSIR